jgi:hypothetical protein
MDQRDANETARITGAGTGATPKTLKFNLGSVKLCDAFGLAGGNIHRAGGAAIQLGLTDGDSGAWDETFPLFHTPDNILPNGGLELFSAITVAAPAAGTSQLSHWGLTTGTGYFKAAPYSWSFLPPEVPAQTENRLYGVFRSAAATETLRGPSQFCMFKSGATNTARARLWLHTNSLTVTQLKVKVAELDASLAILGTPTEINLPSLTLSVWTEYTLSHSITNASTRYLAVILELLGSSGQEVLVDNVSLSVDKEPQSFNDIYPSGYLFRAFNKPIPAQYVKLTFVNTPAIGSAVDAFVQFGRLLIGKALVIGMEESIGSSDDTAVAVDLAQGGSPIEIISGSPSKQFSLTYKSYKRGEAEMVEQTLYGKQGSQLFLSMFNESARERAMLCHLRSGGVSSSETIYRDFKSISLDFERES